MGKAPERSARVFLVGAGLSSAFGLPNTQELLTEAHALSQSSAYWGATKNLEQHLLEAYLHFYPIETAEAGTGFRPNVTDFFSVLSRYEDVTKGLPNRGLTRAGELLTDLKRAIAYILIDDLRDVDELLRSSHDFLDEMLQPGNLVVTTNWDVLLERYAYHHEIPVRCVVRRPEEEVTLLKLHGSIDWALFDDAPRSNGRLDWPARDYGSLRQRLFGPRTRRIRPTKSDDPIVRIEVHDEWTSGWQRIKSRASKPLMVTMSLGKTVQVTDVEHVWRDAYSALSRARSLHVVGYSLPDDDLEIRTLLIAGLRRGSVDADIIVQNPSPEVHERFRSNISREVKAVFQPVPPPS